MPTSEHPSILGPVAPALRGAQTTHTPSGNGTGPAGQPNIDWTRYAGDPGGTGLDNCSGSGVVLRPGPVRRRPFPRGLPRVARRAYRLADLLGLPRVGPVR